MAEINTQQLEQLRKEIVNDRKEGAERGKLLQDVKASVDSIVRWRPHVERKIEKFDHTLFGNGEPGMDEILRRVVTFIDKQEKKEAERWSDTKKFVIGTLAFVVNTLLAIWISRLIP